MTGLTVSKLEKRLRFLLDTSTIVWKKASKTTWAYMQPSAGAVTIALPPDKDDDHVLRLLFHELCHYALPGELMAFGEFEEDILGRVLEPKLMEHVTNHRTIQRWWLKRLRELKEAK